VALSNSGGEMALILLDKTKCPLCGAVIKEGQQVAAFPNFVANELDPLWVFSDGAFHAECFKSHPLSRKADARYMEIMKRNGPGNRSCVVCTREIKDPDEYFSLGHLTEDKNHSLYVYNYTQAHRSCLPEWRALEHVHAEAVKLMRSDSWKGIALEKLVTDLASALAIEKT
jgi:predicted nucleic acid-binding Zn ribbon protein